MTGAARHSFQPAPVAARIAESLVRDGWALEHDFLPPAAIAALARRLRRHAGCGRLRPARIGGPGRVTVAPSERGDQILWIEPPLARPESELLDALELLRLELNASLALGAFSLECHYALYAPGARYVRHLDRSPYGRERVLSFALYLNRSWTPSDGGALVLYGDPPWSVLPQAGTLIVFQSERFEHEVEPARRERLSVAGWFSRRTTGP